MNESGGPSLDVLGEIEVAVSARLGLARVPLATAATFAEGSVVSLDCAPDAPVALIANGVVIATGDLVVTDDGLLAVEIKQVPA